MEEEKNSRKRPELVFVAGIPFRFNDPPYAVSGKYRSRLFVCNPKSKKNELQLKLVEKSTPEKVIREIEAIMQSFPAEHREMILDWIHCGDLDPTFNNWYRWQREYMASEMDWTRPVEEYDEAWKTVEDTMGQVQFSQVRTEFQLTRKAKELIEKQFRKVKSVHNIENCEKLVWAILSDMVELMIRAQLLETNPIRAIARKKSILASTLRSRALNQRSFSASQLSQYLQLCLKLDNRVMQAALIIRALLGLTVYELCGLDIGSYKKKPFPCFEIVKWYYQERGKAPEMQIEPESLNSIRRVAFSSVMIQFVDSWVDKRKQESAGDSDPLFVDAGERLTPNAVKKAEKKLVGKVLASSELDRQRGDFIRSNAEFYLLNVAGMTNAEAESFLGRDRVHTYGRNYVDWNNGIVLGHVSRKLDRWHSRYLALDSDTGRERKLRTYVLKASIGCVLDFNCEGEFYLSLAKTEKAS